MALGFLESQSWAALGRGRGGLPAGARLGGVAPVWALKASSDRIVIKRMKFLCILFEIIAPKPPHTDIIPFKPTKLRRLRKKDELCAKPFKTLELIFYFFPYRPLFRFFAGPRGVQGVPLLFLERFPVEVGAGG